MAGITSDDLVAVLDFLEDARSAAGTAPFTRQLVDRLRDLVGCDYARYKEIDFARRVEIAYLPCSAEIATFGEDLDEMTEADWNAIPSDPCYRATFSEPTGIFIASDLASRPSVTSDVASSWRAEFDREGFVDRMWIQIDGPPWAGVAFDSCERAFGERDRELARVLQPHLGELWRYASVRRRLRAALSALDHEQDEGVLLLDAAGGIEFASRSARRILSDYYDSPAIRLPDEIADWHASQGGTLVIETHRSALVVEATEGRSVLLLSERPPGMGTLTAREREVMRCVEDGLSNPEIAQRLWIQPTTVRKHLEHVFDKLGVRSRTAALAKLHASSRAKAS
jgi:DNA-binding CsgD family transcriptional regulator